MDLSQAPTEGLRCPQLRLNWTQTFGSQLRGFNHSWFKQYTWLEYLASADAVLCYAWRHFCHHGSGHRMEKSFTHGGF